MSQGQTHSRPQQKPFYPETPSPPFGAETDHPLSNVGHSGPSLAFSQLARPASLFVKLSKPIFRSNGGARYSTHMRLLRIPSEVAMQVGPKMYLNRYEGSLID